MFGLSPDNPNFATSSPSLFECAQFVGWVERLVRRSSTNEGGNDSHPLLLGTAMGFAALYPSCGVCDFCRRASPRTQAAQSRTVAALRQSRPFRHGPVVLRFANRPCPPLLSAQFSIHWRCRYPARAKKHGYGRAASLQLNSRRERPKKLRAPMLA